MSDDQQRDDRNRLSFLQSGKDGVAVLLHDLLVTLGVVVFVGLLLFAASGVWPPLVAVESGSMEPNLQKGDFVFVSEEGRYTPDSPQETGVISAKVGREIDYRSYGGYGSVIVYSPPGQMGSPIIHRARFWVEEGENWYEKADADYLQAENCVELENCPAPHAGYVTKGDANQLYDQAAGIPPVRSDWIKGNAHFRIPKLGWIRLYLGSTTPEPPVASIETSGQRSD